jgi:hypothetical protein
MAKRTKDAENVYVSLVMVSLGAWKKTLAGHTVYKSGSILIPVSAHLSVFLRQYL